MKLHLENLKGRPLFWWVGEIISYIVPTILLFLASRFRITTYDPIAYVIAIIGIITTMLIVFCVFRILGNIIKKRLMK